MSFINSIGDGLLKGVVFGASTAAAYYLVTEAMDRILPDPIKQSPLADVVSEFKIRADEFMAEQ